jgi:predicted amidophosphoribosyltransferase
MGERVLSGAVRCCACRSVVPADVLAAVGGLCPHCDRPLSSVAKHDRPVAHSLEWADETSARGQQADTLDELADDWLIDSPTRVILDRVR